MWYNILQEQTQGCPQLLKWLEKKFLSSRTVIIDRRSQSFLGGSGGIPPENFYILSPQKRTFLAFEWAQISYSLSTKLLVTFRFIRIMNLRFQCGFLILIPRA